MTTIILPRLARQTDYNLRRVRNSEVQRAGTGGSLSPLTRAGDHWAMEIDPRALGTVCGRELMADLSGGVANRVRVFIPQPGVDTGAPGLPKVKGAGQAGTSLLLDGLTPQYPIRKGWFLTVVTAEGATAHIVTAEAIVAANGEVTVSFWPELWLQPADNDGVEIAEPYLEGLVVDEGGQASAYMAAVMTDPFVIEEG